MKSFVAMTLPVWLTPTGGKLNENKDRDVLWNSMSLIILGKFFFAGLFGELGNYQLRGMALIELGKKNIFPRLQSRNRNEDERRGLDGIPLEGHSQQMETGSAEQVIVCNTTVWCNWLIRRGRKLTESKELFTESKELFLRNGMLLIILGKILCWSINKWLEQLVNWWNAQKGVVRRVGMNRGPISLNVWNNSSNSVSALCVRPGEKGPWWQTSRWPPQQWPQTGRRTPRGSLRKQLMPMTRAQGAGQMLMSFFEIMAVTGVGQEIKCYELFDVIITMEFFCVPLIGYGGQVSAGVIALRNCQADMELRSSIDTK